MSINILAPGVYSTVTDLTEVVASQPSTTGFVAVISEQGRDNELIRTTRSTLTKTYGIPDITYTNNSSYGYGMYIAHSFLEQSDNLYILRCLPDSATYANLAISTTASLTELDSSGVATDETITTSTVSIESMEKVIDLETQLSTSTDTSGGYTLVIFRGLGRGEFYNSLQIDLNKHPNSGLSGFRKDLYIIDVYLKQRFTSRFISTDSTSGGNDYADYSIVEQFEVSFDPLAKDPGGNSQYIEDVINEFSEYIRVESARNILQEIARREKLDTSSGELTIDFSEGFVGSYTSSNGSLDIPYGVNMSEGDSGGLFTQHGLDTTVANALLVQAYNGTLASSTDGTTVPVSHVLDTENFQFDIVFDAGYPVDVKDAIINLVNTRRDCFAIIDNGDNKTANAAITERTAGDTFSYNTPYSAVFEPYTKVFDQFTARDLWVPPSYHLAKIIPSSDRRTELWYPFAGLERATISGIKEMRYNPALADREIFIKYQINPIVKFPEGYTLFSQRTTLRKDSARQDINVIRLVNFIDRSLKSFCKNYIFELNDSFTHNLIANEINKFLREIKVRRGLQAYSVSVKATKYDMQKRRVIVEIVLEPVRAIEQIHLQFYIK